MKEIEVIRYLLDEIEEEQKRLEYYKKSKKEAEAKADKESVENDKYVSYYRFFDWEGNIPSESLIKQNKKKIRKLVLKIKGECI